MTRVYLDHAATSPIRPEATEAMREGFAQWANPSSPHGEGRRARAALEDARERIRAALDWNGEVVLTSGATEGLAIALGRAQADRRLISAVEHDAVFRAAPDAEIVPLAKNDDGRCGIDRDRLAGMLAQPGRAVVAVQSVNSETGTVLLPYQDRSLVNQVREAGALFLADCSQSAGKVPLPEADMIVVSAHKLGGPIGV